MADDKTIKGPQDSSRINLAEDYEVQYWMKKLDISKEELTRLTLKHKGSAEAVREALGR